MCCCKWSIYGLLDGKNTFRAEFTIVPATLTIYEFKNKEKLLGYLFILNGIVNYLNKDKQPFKDEELHLIKKQMINGKISRELLWGEDYE